MKKFFKLLVLTLAISLLFTTGVSAKNVNGKKSYVALGDSIPYGLNLSQSNASAARIAFPYIIGEEENVRVRNLGVPGWTSGQLLEAVQTDQKYRQAVRHADYVSLTIGSNDLLRALKTADAASGGDPILFFTLLQAEIKNSDMFENIGKIITEIRTLTNAPIVVYNVYNPFQLKDPLHTVGDLVLPKVNEGFSNLVDQYNFAYGDVYIADAYSTFGDDQANYVRVGDIHPTVAGQIKLAEIGLEALGLEE